MGGGGGDHSYGVGAIGLVLSEFAATMSNAEYYF